MARLLLLPLLLATLAAIFMVARADTQSDCGLAQTAVDDCVPFITGKEHTLSKQCCKGWQAVNSLVNAGTDKKSLCECLKSALAAAGTIDSDRAAITAIRCNAIHNLLPTSPTYDCSKVV